jgi:alpha-galactosidase
LKNIRSGICVLLLSCSWSLAVSQTNAGKVGDNPRLALTPPMGWNSWNFFEMNISEEKIKSIADAMVSSGMRDAGYEYLVIDDAWMAKERNSKGELVADPEKFPNGMKAVGDYIHSKGLKFGLYECRGYLTCQKLPGSFQHEEQDMRSFAEWGVDYVKLDACFAERNNRPSDVDLALYRKAINQTGRPMILSISDFGNGSWAWGAAKYAQLWRTSYDIRATIGSVLYCASSSGGSEMSDPAFNGLWQFAGPGQWNDPDMLEVGNLGSAVQDRFHFSLWCILAAPLMAGNDLRVMPDSVRKILTAREVIAVDQDPRGFQGYKIFDNGDLQVYNKPLADGTAAVLLLNKGKQVSDVSVTWNQIGLSGSQPVRDLWEEKNIGSYKDGFTARQLPQYGHMLIKVGKPGSQPLPGPTPVPLEKYTISGKSTQWLSDIYYLMKQGEAPRKDANGGGRAISLKGQTYKKGLGCFTGSRIMYQLNGKGSRLQAVIGMDDEYKGTETARFKVLNGDFFGAQVLFDSGKIGKDSTVKIDIDVKGVQFLLLTVDGKKLPVNWADIKVIPQ